MVCDEYNDNDFAYNKSLIIGTFFAQKAFAYSV